MALRRSSSACLRLVSGGSRHFQSIGARNLSRTNSCYQGSTGEDTEAKTEATGEQEHPRYAGEDVTPVTRPHPCVDMAIRVNYAGELAAARLCAGRMSALGKSEKIKLMEEKEKEHAELFKKLMAKRRVRPSLTLPLWDLGGFALGAVSSVFSEDVAKACSEAVEDVINDHYNSQLREFISQGIEDDDLLKGIVKCRDDELDTELGGLQQESSYDSLRETVKNGCQLAIWLTERI